MFTRTIKAKIKKLFYLSSGRFDHIKVSASASKQWYGNDYGGFYASPDFLDKSSVVYSFGVGKDVSFDKAVIDRHGCEVHAFDPTPSSIDWIRQQHLSSKFQFHPYGIAAQSGRERFYLPKNKAHVSGSIVQHAGVDQDDCIEVELKTLSQIASDLGHGKIDVLKMDIEGTEYDVLNDVVDSGIRINQILIEFHERLFNNGKQKTTETLKILEQGGFRVFGVSDSFEEVSMINEELI